MGRARGWVAAACALALGCGDDAAPARDGAPVDGPIDAAGAADAAGVADAAGASDAAPADAAGPLELGLVPLFPNLSTAAEGPLGNSAPILVRRVQLPDASWTWILALRNGRIVALPDPGAVAMPATNVLDPTGWPDLSDSEAGFVGLAFDPGLATDPSRAHAYFVRARYGSVSLHRGDVVVDEGGVRIEDVIEVLSAGAGGHHYGGDVQFGPDGYLYISVGEDEIFARTRSPRNLRGKILRIDVHAAIPLPGKVYGIPADNPYRLDGFGEPNPACYESGAAELPDAATDCPEVYARGFRNPFRFSFDAVGGALWVGDAGAASEEVDRVTLGGDYGWNTQEGVTTPDPGITPAAFELPRTGCAPLGYAVIGGAVYRGAAIPALVGHYVAADFGSGKLYDVADPYGAPVVTLRYNEDCADAVYPASFASDENGELLLTSLDPATGRGVFRIIAQ